MNVTEDARGEERRDNDGIGVGGLEESEIRNGREMKGVLGKVQSLIDQSERQWLDAKSRSDRVALELILTSKSHWKRRFSRKAFNVESFRITRLLSRHFSFIGIWFASRLSISALSHPRVAARLSRFSLDASMHQIVSQLRSHPRFKEQWDIE